MFVKAKKLSEVSAWNLADILIRISSWNIIIVSSKYHLISHRPWNIVWNPTIFLDMTDFVASLHARVVLDSWVVSQIWLDSDSNESSQSRVGRENQGYESSQSRVTLIVIWVRVESTGYCLSQTWVNDWGENVKILQLSVTLQRKCQPTATFDRTPPPNFFPN